ncbi:FAD-dependent oxidoreductase [Amycolatopsis sp. NPDC048633]|uniref:FAD-dependent oxidoreductase n=1 Tax=Amycolatopsis sp. NPDC048633 TaxID=3157095 RepID=UPI00340EBCF7
MSDRRRTRIPAPPGVAHARDLGRRPAVAVVGAGIAGLAAATALAERGVAVTVFEREEYAGGRAGGWPHTLADGSAVTMSRGFHAFFRQYYNLRALLRRTDPGLDRLAPLHDYPLLDARGRTDTFAGLPRTPPWNALAFALRSPTFRTADLLRLKPRAAWPLVTVRVPEIYERLDGIDAATFLERLNFPLAARHLAFEVFSRSFFADPGRLSAAELAVMFHLYFLGSSEGLVFDVPTEPFSQALWDPLVGYLSTSDVSVRLGVAVSSIDRDRTGRLVVHPGDGPALPVDAVVLACDPGGLRRLVAASPALGDDAWRNRVAAVREAPPFLVRRLWLDRGVAPERSPFLGTGSLRPLDNISVLDRYEGEAGRWAVKTGGSVVELHAYAVDTADRAAVSRRALDRLHALYPETAGARIVDEVSLWRQDCPLFGVGTFPARPTVTTPDPDVVLAGDGIRVDLPVALMERAATTGFTAAGVLLAGWGLAGHPLTTVPNHGRFAVRRR